MLSGVDPLVDQTKGILDNLNTSLNDSKTALESTGNALQKVQAKTEFSNSRSECAQKFPVLSGFSESDRIGFGSSFGVYVCTGSSENRVLLSGENYGSAMTPFYTNLAIWVWGDCVDRNFQTGV